MRFVQIGNIKIFVKESSPPFPDDSVEITYPDCRDNNREKVMNLSMENFSELFVATNTIVALLRD